MDREEEYKLLERFSEPSSYAGLGVALGATGLALPGWASSAALIFSGICGVLAFIMKEKGGVS